MGDKVSVASVDIAVVHVCDLDEGGALGFLAATRSEKPVQTAGLSRESNKKPPLVGRSRCQLGTDFLTHRGDRIRTCGILLPKQQGD